MLLTFLISAFIALVGWKRAFGKRAWTIFIVLICIVSSLIAYVSIASVWTPHPLSDDVFHQQNALGEYEGVSPFSKLSFPLYLKAYHSPFASLLFEENGTAYGQATFSIYLINRKVIDVSGVFSYFYMVMGPMPLNYKIDSIDSPTFFALLIALFTLANIVGALPGIILAKTTLKKRVKAAAENRGTI